MPPQDKTEIEFEIAHVLFIDTVGYSKLLIDEQREVLKDLNRVVRASSRFSQAGATGKLIRLPTGDGMALIFSDSPESPVQCAIEIARKIAEHPRLQLRMGIHSGPVSRVTDVNDQSNAAGAGINIAQRVMSCGDAGHILLSKRAADDLAEYSQWRPHLHEIGECEVKHGNKIALVNFYTDEVGNVALPVHCQRHDVRSTPKNLRDRGRKLALLLGGIAVLIVIILALVVRPTATENKSPVSQATSPPLAVSDKSIAVLPFDNLSDDKQNAYFAEGMQDEILTNLVKVSDIKVISRTSVMQYASGQKRNLREIGATLGVAHVLEGAVQRIGDKIRISVQLIDARTDSHEWAETYNRDVADVFALQSELAESIVAVLKARLSPEERAAIEEQPTSDLVAYDYYIRAKANILAAVLNVRERERLFEAIDLLNAAIARDGKFFLAYYHLARTHDRLYILGIDHTAQRLQLADGTIKNVLRLRPKSGEAHLALAAHLYTLRDYDGARRELADVGRRLPNEPLVFELSGYIDRRQGNWEGCVNNLERVQQLDPNNVFNLQQIGLAYQDMRRFPEMIACLDRALILAPKDSATRVQRAAGDLDCCADPRNLHATVTSIITEDPGAAAAIATARFYLALCERDHVATLEALSTMTQDACRNEGIPFPRAWCEGVAARARGDTATAGAAFKKARTEIEKVVQAQPDYAEAICVLGLIDSGLGRKEDAIAEGRRALELLPISKDAINGGLLIEYLALIYAWTGEKDLALRQLENAIRVPSDLSYGQLRLHPNWDTLRGDPRFEKIVASLAPESLVTPAPSATDKH